MLSQVELIMKNQASLINKNFKLPQMGCHLLLDGYEWMEYG